LVLAILLQPMWPAIIYIGLTTSLRGANSALGGLPGFDPDLPPQGVQAEPKWDLLSLPEFIGAAPALAQEATDCLHTYLPLILKQASASAASSPGAVTTSVRAEALFPGLEFGIISPR
jgi:hypothetical protein